MSSYIGLNNFYAPTIWSMLNNVFEEIGGVVVVDKIIYENVGRVLFFYDMEHLDSYAEPQIEGILKRVGRESKGIKTIVYSKDDSQVIVDLFYKNIALRLYGVTKLDLVPSLEDRSVREVMYMIREKLEERGYRTYDISYRDGFTIFMVEAGDKRVIVWVRKSPLTSKALELFKKIVGKYEYDKVMILRTEKTADLIKLPEELKPHIVTKADEALRCIEDMLKNQK